MLCHPFRIFCLPFLFITSIIMNWVSYSSFIWMKSPNLWILSVSGTFSVTSKIKSWAQFHCFINFPDVLSLTLLLQLLVPPILQNVGEIRIKLNINLQTFLNLSVLQIKQNWVNLFMIITKLLLSYHCDWCWNTMEDTHNTTPNRKAMDNPTCWKDSIVNKVDLAQWISNQTIPKGVTMLHTTITKQFFLITTVFCTWLLIYILQKCKIMWLQRYFIY